MSDVSFDEVLGLDDEFDPLMVDDLMIDQEDMDDDNPLDTVDYPTMRNMPQSMQRDAVYTPKRQGSVEAAVLELLDHNPARRPVLLSIMGMCRGGCASSEVSTRVEAAQTHNRSVYAPMTLCRMLERAGALTLELPEVAEPHEDADEGVTYLEIKQRVDPVWRTTDEGAALYEELTRGAAFRDIVLDRDSRYLDVYRAVMDAVLRQPRTKPEIEELVDAFDVVKSPRRFGGHFIDMLERTDALEWNDHAWKLTELGRSMLPVVEAAASEKKEMTHA
ncbi:hypothetical protein [Eggerthella sinensis]|uniref:hypothetical protein n=1 Tax=Eggerthella sinensis TaxID=242230 RepID=UPI00248F123D|nr:hypothetical protein [Eggerthella sinensis]